ncbi:MAG: DHH family phosphoesterase [Firmicutes bacterium]|nr:DHH family phosphoesterase [Bacillota bacterium]
MNNNNKFQRLIEPSMRMMLIILVIFAAAALFFDYRLAAVEAGVVLILIVYSIFAARRRRKQLTEYVESLTYDVENARNDTLMNFPLPMVAFRVENLRIIWGNQTFFSICGAKPASFEKSMLDYIPDFSGKWLLEGKDRYPGLLEVRGRRYQVHGCIVRTDQKDGGKADFMAIAYWVDVTDYEDIRLEHLASRPVVAVVVWDNYDELLKNVSDRQRTELRGAVDELVEQFCQSAEGFVRRYDRDRYVFVFEERRLKAYIEQKFSLIDNVHKVTSPSGIHATVSIGIGRDGKSLEESFQFASLAVEMALSRGGDQAVIKNRFSFEFFGGRGTEVETRTKVKSRVMANALAELIADASQVYIMGHKFADLDTIGAASGICCIARKKGKKAYIVADLQNNAAEPLIAKLRREAEYKNTFVSAQEALFSADSRSLLVVVDTSRPEQVESESLLQALTRVAVIDHHRRAASYIKNAALNFHEPYASSVCELVSELLQELVEQGDIFRVEAEAMLAGISLDTKNFTIRTGARTFDAAAFLRRAGADTSEVKRLLQNDLESTVARYKILQRAKLYRGIAIAAPEEPQRRVVAAQAADELLNISGVQASMVVFPTEDGGINVSARSIGDVNVQVLLEKLGGGGNASAAGAQMGELDLKESVNRLLGAIDEYFDG